jgi:CDP-glucose 4,6-dehydratase
MDTDTKKKTRSVTKGGFWGNRRVFVTGHTGFKGSWLSLWLKRLGADVAGYSLGAPSEPNHFQLLDLKMPSIEGDIRDRETLRPALEEHKPEIIFHLAAQALVRRSYRDPLETFSTNIMGTAHLFEACRHVPSVRALVNITSDKCYENREWLWGYRENERLGGHDPYSASKACAELITASYRNSFFNLNDFGKTHNVLVASARAGNVIGGGDWAEDRLIPDIIRAASARERVLLRNPYATRPWQHVLDPLRGYLLLGEKLLQGRKDFAGPWNFGPNEEARATVEDMVLKARERWPAIEYVPQAQPGAVHEAASLHLDTSKARTLLGWRPLWDLSATVSRTIEWYRAFYEEGKVNTEGDLEQCIEEEVRIGRGCS